MNSYQIYTDGGCRQTKVGGWAAIIMGVGPLQEISGAVAETTNNRMELLAVVEALKLFPVQTSLTIYSDSKYVIQGASSWLDQWRQRGWKTRKNSPVKNLDLWRALDQLASLHKVQWTWVRGHDGDSMNERADYLANRAMDQGAVSQPSLPSLPSLPLFS